MSFMGCQREFRPISDEVLAAALAAAEDAIVITEAEPLGSDPYPTVVYVNDGFTRMTGYLAHEIIGRSPRICQGPATDRKTLDRIRAKLAAWEPVCEQIVNYKKDGTPFWVELNIRPVADATGWFTHWISIQRDVTVRILQQEAAARQAQALRDAFVRAKMGTWRWRMADARLSIAAPVGNGAVEERQEALADLLSAMPRPDRAMVIRLIRQMGSDAAPVTFECHVSREDGQPRTIWVQARLDRDSDGKGEGVVGLWQDISGEREMASALQWTADHDTLTRLLTRSALLSAGARMADAHAPRRQLVAIVFDIHGLELVNDTHGYWLGDLYLKEAAACLRTRAPTSLIARSSGDQFLLLDALPCTEDPVKHARQLVDALKAAETLGDYSVSMTISAGVACGAPPDVSVEDIVRNASIAIAHARSQGSGRIAQFDQGMRVEFERKAGQLALAQQALAQDLIVPFYQPKIRLSDGALTGFEALLRISEGGRVRSPADVASAFDDPVLAPAVGKVMLQKLLRQLADWNGRGLVYGAVSLNVTGHELADPEFATRFLSEMARHGVLPSQVEVEVTEGVVMGDLDSCPVRQLARLQAAGVQVALDDFGTGFASLTHLRSVPIAALKIDRSFVTQVCCSQRDAAIIDGIAMIGQALGLTIVVEGVESAAQAAKVRELGCDTMQGYLGGRPQDGAATEQLIRSWPGQQHRIDALIQDAGTSSRLRAHRAARHR